MNLFLQKYWLLLLVLLFITHQLVQLTGVLYLPFFHSYLDPFVAMPVFLNIWAWERKNILRLPALGLFEIATLTLLVFMLFEIILPAYSVVYIRDWWDGVAYILGSSIYYGMTNQ